MPEDPCEVVKHLTGPPPRVWFGKRGCPRKERLGRRCSPQPGTATLQCNFNFSRARGGRSGLEFFVFTWRTIAGGVCHLQVYPPKFVEKFRGGRHGSIKTVFRSINGENFPESFTHTIGWGEERQWFATG